MAWSLFFNVEDDEDFLMHNFKWLFDFLRHVVQNWLIFIVRQWRKSQIAARINLEFLRKCQEKNVQISPSARRMAGNRSTAARTEENSEQNDESMFGMSERKESAKRRRRVEKKERQKQIIATQPWICCCEFQENRELFPISHLMRRCRRNYRECWFDFREFCWEKLHELPWCCVCWLLRSKSKQLLQSDTKCLHKISNSKSFQ